MSAPRPLSAGRAKRDHSFHANGCFLWALVVLLVLAGVGIESIVSAVTR